MVSCCPMTFSLDKLKHNKIMSNPEVIELNVDDPATIQLNTNDFFSS